MKRPTKMIRLLLAFGLSFLASSPTVANDKVEVETKGDVRIFHPDSKDYWFNLNGLLQVDETLFFGSYPNLRNDYPSGANVRRLEVDVAGGVGPNWSYNIEFDFDGAAVNFGNIYIRYLGFQTNTHVLLGQVPVPFGLENSNSSKWIPFLERSLPVVALVPQFGLGVNARILLQDRYTLAGALVSPQQGLGADPDRNKSDRPIVGWRATYSPIHTDTEAYHFAYSGYYRNVATYRPDGQPLSNIAFATRPEARARRTAFSVNTGLFRGNYYYVNCLEFGYLNGPFLFATEYLSANVKQVGTYNDHLHFHGFHIQGSYSLTGEGHSYNFANGNFGPIIPKSPTGALEIAARYSMVDLNDKNILGGRENNVSLALDWYVNSQLKISGNYILARVHPPNAQPVRQFSILGVRAQVYW